MIDPKPIVMKPMKPILLWLSRALLPLMAILGLCFYLRTSFGGFSAPSALALMCLALVVGVFWAEHHRQAARRHRQAKLFVMPAAGNPS